MKTYKLALIFLFSAFCWPVVAAELKLISPNRKISVDVLLKEKIYYTVLFKGKRVLEASP